MKINQSFKRIIGVNLLACACMIAGAQTIVKRDSQIAEAVNAVSVSDQRLLINDLVAFHNRNNYSSLSESNRGIGAAADYLYKRVSAYIPRSSGRLSVEKIFYRVEADNNRISRPLTLPNVVATIKGTNVTDNRVIAVLAHFDNRGKEGSDSLSFVPGANDNGSGVAALMEMARLLSQMELSITVKLMFLSGEEHGLYGADYMAKRAKESNMNLIAVLNNDMIGNSDASETHTHDNTTLRVFSETIPLSESEEMARLRQFSAAENDSPSRQLARYIKEVGERYVDNMTVKLIYRNDRYGRGGDHTPFSRQGFSAVRLCEVNENYDRTHVDVYESNGKKYGDVIEGIDFEYLRKNTAVNLSVVANMAMAPSVPENVRLDASKLTNRVHISWEAPRQGSRPSGYYVLIRETDQSMWQKKIFVKETSVDLPYSKDNYLFAVQSVNGEGHESLAAFAYGKR